MHLTVSNTSDFSILSATPRWQQLQHPLLRRHNTELWLCHLTTAIAAVSGNKCLKLKHHLAQAKAEGKLGIVTFGGAFSNHLSAVAATCNALNLQSKAYIRTDQLDLSNPTLQFCAKQGMQFIPLDRASYRQKSNPEFTAQVSTSHPDFFLVPEGGSSLQGATGVAELELVATPAGPANLLVSAVASGGTLAGMINRQAAPVLGIAVVKDASLVQRVQQFLQPASEKCPWHIDMEHTFGGYARFDVTLLDFCRAMAVQQVFVEPIYTGKALYGLFQRIEQGKIAAGSRISFFHTGGLQGLNGLYYRKLISAADLVQLSGSGAG